jgi:hypothetical protein
MIMTTVVQGIRIPTTTTTVVIATPAIPTPR